MDAKLGYNACYIKHVITLILLVPRQSVLIRMVPTEIRSLLAVYACVAVSGVVSKLSDSCHYHPGVPVFHDALKGWSCCKKRSTDFTEFLNIPVRCLTIFYFSTLLIVDNMPLRQFCCVAPSCCYSPLQPLSVLNCVLVNGLNSQVGFMPTITGLMQKTFIVIVLPQSNNGFLCIFLGESSCWVTLL